MFVCVTCVSIWQIYIWHISVWYHTEHYLQTVEAYILVRHVMCISRVCYVCLGCCCVCLTKHFESILCGVKMAV